MKSWLRRWWWTIPVALVVVVVGAALIWAMTPLGPTENALAALESDDAVEVTRTDLGYEFAPVGVEPTAALVFYPGGRVDLRSYAPFARDVARSGYLVVVPAMPLSLAVLNPDAADDAIAAHPDIETWVVGGHSLGGAMAATYADDNADSLAGLLLLAAYANDGDDMSGESLKVVDVTATNDLVLSQENWQAGKARLPGDASFVVIDGGNHAQFGDYGPQPGDGEATMAADEQRRLTSRATILLMATAAR